MTTSFSRYARSALFACLALPAGAWAQSGNSLLISTEERCALNRVDDESLPLALESCEDIAEAGNLHAQYELGEFYYHGERTERDIETALAWYERASLQGHPGAQYRLGLMHSQGEGVERNLPQAYVILKMAAVNGKDAAMDASDTVATQMNQQELAAATQVLSTLFRNYLSQIREEQLSRSPTEAAPTMQLPEPAPSESPQP
ncbi:hypothetical protein SAMN05216421_0454 [Halopseudomonas xinjiangensis]|uniref:Sel1 repeat-containing protein n=1 Tax=Halopseudomonas xinjiangensis TaxID=487184 RepID=A0A1H1MI33_9GAMM|nr:tetratricopeptide repeat protein [Halopseudomonas xinjiangensis]SDR85649.1 hypothetical protein SAMN05216421_0454 [Halopseudomonas xinjiangensis]